MKFACLVGAVLVSTAAAHAGTSEQLFNNNCAICHQVGGAGVAGAFPRLAGRAGAIAATSEGRAFLVSLVLNGMSGSVTVDGKTIVGVMPDFSSFSDEDLAAILTYVAGLGGGKAQSFAPEEVKVARATPPVAPTDLAVTRNKLQAAKVIP